MKTATREKPILFSTPMVKAILAGRKTMTRRVILPKQIEWSRGACAERDYGAIGDVRDGQVRLREWPGVVIGVTKPRYAVGDVLWVRETFLYRLDRNAFVYRANLSDFDAAGISGMYGGWKPSIFMPRAACRIFLRVTEVRAERLWNITFDDIGCEGFSPRADDEHFKATWNVLNAKRGYPWESNPPVFVYRFERITTENTDAK